ncbi:uncharacterized protein KY384_003383 [Bacidia gigantensis]|uniref:uncharacterized protein n=1 Tax=Bacidia gigantensis TaxID=2732470 RepID=UPI001D0465EF|nr:uncharacterized protein KY384_003383 [Bacidia gigantensis]KAG8531751.1 hypothetical protein KY384_003383 [Bacidia gigantensis]
MRASEWQYLCAVHEPPKPCCAIDYSCHTLDWAAYILTSQKHFPIYRIFAHAWFQHRGVFLEVEGREGLYVLYKTVCDVYGLIPEENYTIPREAEGGEEGEEDEEGEQRARPRSPEKRVKTEGSEEERVGARETTTTQRRHKATPSVGSAIAPIQEDEEEKGEHSPAKEKPTVMPEGNALEGKGGPLAAISKTAEAKESPVVNEPEATDATSTSSQTDQDSNVPSHSSLPRSNSSDSVSTMVKVEEKEEDNE